MLCSRLLEARGQLSDMKQRLTTAENIAQEAKQMATIMEHSLRKVRYSWFTGKWVPPKCNKGQRGINIKPFVIAWQVVYACWQLRVKLLGKPHWHSKRSVHYSDPGYCYRFRQISWRGSSVIESQWSTKPMSIRWFGQHEKGEWKFAFQDFRAGAQNQYAWRTQE